MNLNSVTQDQIQISHVKNREGNDGFTSLKTAGKPQPKTTGYNRDVVPEISLLPKFEHFVSRVSENLFKKQNQF